MNSAGPEAQLPFRVDITPRPDDLIFAVDAQARIVYWGGEVERVLGYSRRDALGADMRRFFSVSGLDLDAVAAGAEFAGAVECRSASGAILSLYLYGVGGRAVSGPGRGVVFVARDVSELRRAEEAVRFSEDKYRLLFESTTDAVAITDMDGRVLEANPAYLRLYGYTADEVRKTKFVDPVAPEQRALAASALADLAAGRGFSAALDVVRKDGARFVADVVASVVQVGGQRRILSVTRDVTARVRAEEKIKASERRYRAMFEAVQDGLLLETMDGRILDANTSACRMLGYRREELIQKTVADLVPEETKKWLPALRETVAKLGVHRVEGVNVRKDGTPFPVEIVLARTETDSGPAVVVYLRDLTERRRAEQALEDSRESYRTMFETTGAATIAIEENTTISLANQEFERLTGYRRDQVIGQSWTLYIHHDDQERMADYHRRRRLDPRAVPQDHEFRLVDRSGVTRDCHLTMSLIPGTKTTIASFVDITERKRIERLLVESEERYRTLVNNAPIGIYRTTPDGRVLLVNPSLVRMLGYRSEAELVQVNLEKTEFCFTHPRREFKDRVEREGEIRGLEAEWVRRDGRTLYVRENARTVRGADGGVLYYEGTVEDVTDRHRMTEALRESEEKFRGVAEHSPNMIFINRRGRVVYANRRCSEVMGYAPEELIGPEFDFLSLIAPESRDAVGASYQRHRRGEEVEPYEYTLITRSGAKLEAIIATKLIDYKDGPAILGIITDITERRRAEQALVASEREYRMALDAMHDPVHLADAQLRIIMANRAFGEWLAAFGIDRAIAGRSIFEAFPFLGERVKDEYRTVVDTGKPMVTVETTVIAGRSFVTETTKFPVVDAGRVVRVLTIVRDMTERLTAERAVRESEERYRRLVELSPDGIAVHQDGKVVMVNRAGAHMLGYGDPSELVGRPVFDIVHPDDRALVVERIKRVMAGGGSGALVEERFLAKDGSFVPVEVVNSAFVWHGRPAVQVVVRDISRRVEAERSRRETDANYRAMVEGMGDGVAVHQQGTVVLMNRAGARMLGYDDPAAVEGMSVVGFLHPDQRDAMLERMRQVLAQGGIAPPAAASFRRKDGSYVQLEVANTVLSWQGQPAIQVVFRDVSERQRAEQELRASEERFRRLADASPDGIAVYQDGVVVLVNPAFVTALGYDSPDDALRHPAAEFVHEDDLPTVNTRSMELDGSATPGESLAVRFRRRDGTFVRAEVVGVSTTWQGRPAIQVMARFAARPRRDTA